MNTLRPILKQIARFFLYLFALIGFVFSGVYIAMQFELLNVRGTIAERNKFFIESTSTSPEGNSTKNTPTLITPQAVHTKPCLTDETPSCDWDQTPEWAVVEGGIRKDAQTITRVARETGVSERMIVAVVVPEQIRFFTSNREVFKSWFEPMKILGTLTKFSLGVSGIKQETAELIESHASATSSPFYPGPGMSELIAYNASDNPPTVLYQRLTDEKNHYYSYLYTALFIKEVEAQWASAGYDVSKNPEVIVTLFNIGFNKSHPSASPSAGGAVISVGGNDYTYGGLGAEFYHSSALLAEFPRP